MNYQVMVCAGLFLTCSVSKAQQGSPEVQLLDEVVVSDSRFNLKREQSGKTVIRIDSAEIAQNVGKTAAELINSKSGIEISGSRGRQGEILGVYVRGGRGRQVLVLIDGLRVSDPSSFSQEYDLRFLSLDRVESIEIIKGASSTLYGTNAATAVINITTKKVTNAPIQLYVGSNLGTNQTSGEANYNPAAFNSYAQVSGTLGSLEYSTGISHTYEDNLSSLRTSTNEEDPFSRYMLDLRLAYPVLEGVSLSVFGQQTRLSNAYDETFGMADAPYEFNADQKRAGISLEAAFGKSEWHFNAAYSEFSSENISAFPGSFFGSNQVVDLYHKYTLGKSVRTLIGLNYIKDRAWQSEARDFTLLDPYINLVYTSAFGLNINTGTRLNRHSEYGNKWVYNFNPSYNFSIDEGYLKLMGTVATSYITPSLTQLYGEFGANPELEPETNRTLEAGLEWMINNGIRTSLVYFNRREVNFVFFDSASFLYRNSGGTINAQGIEAEFRWQLLERLGLDANYTFTERKGDNAIRIPRHKINAQLSMALSERTQLSMQYSYTGSRTDTDFNTFTDIRLQPFSLLGLYLSRALIPGKMKVFASVDNLFDESYTEILGFTTRGRNIRLGFSLIL